MRWSIGSAETLTRCETVEGTWLDFASWATRNPPRSAETMAEYHALPKSEQGRLKRADWVVGAVIAGGHRMASAVIERTILTIDIDRMPPEALEELVNRSGFARTWTYCGHVTRSSTPGAPRVRLFFPLAAPVTPEQYQRAARGLCNLLEEAFPGLEADRGASTDAARLMYGPTLCSDAHYVLIDNDGDIPPLEVLTRAGEQEMPREAPPVHQVPREYTKGDLGAPELDSRGIEAMRAAGAIIVPSPRRQGELTTNCLWHDDANPSLDICLDGRMVCRAGCKPGGQPITWLRYVTRARGCSEAEAFQFARDALGIPSPAPRTPAPDELFREITQAVQDVRPDRVFLEETEGEGKHDPYRLTPLSKLEKLRVRQEDRIYGDIITRGCVSVLAGQAGMGKSTLIRHLVSHIAQGRPYLGRDVPPQGATVVVVDFETPAIFRHSFWSDIYGDDGITQITNVLVATETPAVTLESAPSLIRSLAAVRADMVVIDTISAAFLVQNENDNAEMEGVARILRAIAKSGPAVLVIAHPSKGGADIRGASALQGAVETVITFRATTPIGEHGPDEETEFSLAVKKNRVGAMGHEVLRWDGEGGFLAPMAPTPEELTNGERVVLAIVEGRRPGTITQPEILRSAAYERVSNATAKRALRKLLDQGLIRRPAKGQYA